jgi:hypothetical protein
MGRFIASAATHNAAGDETMRLTYHKAVLKCK